MKKQLTLQKEKSLQKQATLKAVYNNQTMLDVSKTTPAKINAIKMNATAKSTPN